MPTRSARAHSLATCFTARRYLQNTTAAISGLLAGTGVPAYAEQSAQLNASLAAFPHPLLDVLQAADLQLQALLAFYNATTWVLPGNGTA